MIDDSYFLPAFIIATVLIGGGLLTVLETRRTADPALATVVSIQHGR